MPRKRTTDSAPPTPVVSQEVETTEPADPKAESDASTAGSEVRPPEPTPPSPSSEPEVQLQPATFALQGRTMICTVCGTEARQNLDHQLFCPNAHNHPPLTSEAPKS